MSVSLYYQPVSNRKKINNGTSGVLAELEYYFGKLPYILDSKDVEKLAELGKYYGNFNPNPYHILIEAIKKHKEILVSEEW